MINFAVPILNPLSPLAVHLKEKNDRLLKKIVAQRCTLPPLSKFSLKQFFIDAWDGNPENYCWFINSIVRIAKIILKIIKKGESLCSPLFQRYQLPL